MVDVKGEGSTEELEIKLKNRGNFSIVIDRKKSRWDGHNWEVSLKKRMRSNAERRKRDMSMGKKERAQNVLVRFD